MPEATNAEFANTGLNTTHKMVESFRQRGSIREVVPQSRDNSYVGLLLHDPDKNPDSQVIYGLGMGGLVAGASHMGIDLARECGGSVLMFDSLSPDTIGRGPYKGDRVAATQMADTVEQSGYDKKKKTVVGGHSAGGYLSLPLAQELLNRGYNVSDVVLEMPAGLNDARLMDQLNRLRKIAMPTTEALNAEVELLYPSPMLIAEMDIRTRDILGKPEGDRTFGENQELEFYRRTRERVGNVSNLTPEQSMNMLNKDAEIRQLLNERDLGDLYRREEANTLSVEEKGVLKALRRLRDQRDKPIYGLLREQVGGKNVEGQGNLMVPYETAKLNRLLGNAIQSLPAAINLLKQVNGRYYADIVRDLHSKGVRITIIGTEKDDLNRDPKGKRPQYDSVSDVSDIVMLAGVDHYMPPIRTQDNAHIFAQAIARA